MKLNKIALAGLVISGSVLLTACGGGDDAPASVAQANTTAAINPSTGAAVVAGVLDKSFAFSSGVPALGTSANTTLTLSGSGATPSFAITSGTATASGNMTYGSCIFNVVTSTFPAGHALAAGQKVTVTPCQLGVATAGVVANGVAAPVNATLQLGSTVSSPVSVQAVINPNGSLTVGGSNVGTVTVVPATGAGN